MTLAAALAADGAPAGAAGLTPAWRKHLTALGLTWAALLAVFHRDAADIAAIWWNSSTFNHCLLILPLIAWLVVQDRKSVV